MAGRPRSRAFQAYLTELHRRDPSFADCHSLFELRRGLQRADSDDVLAWVARRFHALRITTGADPVRLTGTEWYRSLQATREGER